MTILVHDCPRCAARNVGFRYVAETQRDDAGVLYAMFVCPKCAGPVTVLLACGRAEVRQWGGDIRDDPQTEILWTEPKPITPNTPEHVPERVANLYEEACNCLYRNETTAAAAVLRKCLEMALREFAPDVEAWKLEKRIDKMAQMHLITPALQTWAHELRIDGNEALHGDEEPPKALVTHMERLTYFLLVYLYTLPAQVEQASTLRQ